MISLGFSIVGVVALMWLKIQLASILSSVTLPKMVIVDEVTVDRLAQELRIRGQLNLANDILMGKANASVSGDSIA